jgi:hypothetical protein
MMRKLALMLTTLVVLSVTAMAEEPAGASADTLMTGWKTAADLGLNFNQSSYSNSWAGTENAAISWTLAANGEAERQLSRKFNWKNTLKLAFGETHQEARVQAGDQTTRDITRHWLSPEKSSDRIFFETLLRATLGYFVDPFASVTFESQFYDPATLVVEDEPDLTVKRFINPITLTESAGVGRTLMKNEDSEIFTRLGFALRETFSRQVVQFMPEKLLTETTTYGGLEWVTDCTQTLGKDLKYVSKLRVFEALFNSRADDLKGLEEEDYWKSPDVAWENTISASVAKYIQTSLFFEVLYDKEIDLRGRFREVLGLGLSYKLF